MKRWIPLVCLMAISSVLGADKPQVIDPAQTVWTSPPRIKGLSVSWLIGGEAEAGLYAARVKLQKGEVIPPHTHPDERNTVVLSGNLYVGFGESIDETAAIIVAPGSVYIAPAGVPHYLWAKDGDVEYQEVGNGPSATVIVAK